jgi:hypothetical protein
MPHGFRFSLSKYHVENAIRGHVFVGDILPPMIVDKSSCEALNK